MTRGFTIQLCPLLGLPALAALPAFLQSQFSLPAHGGPSCDLVLLRRGAFSPWPTAAVEGCFPGLWVLLNNQLCEGGQQLPQASQASPGREAIGLEWKMQGGGER